VHVPTSRQALTSFSLFSDSSVVVHKLIAFSIDLGFLLFFCFSLYIGCMQLIHKVVNLLSCSLSVKGATPLPSGIRDEKRMRSGHWLGSVF